MFASAEEESASSAPTVPVVNITFSPPATEPQPSQPADLAPPVARRLARGFTITISSPPDEPLLEESSSLSRRGSSSVTTQPGRGKELDHLTPEELSPELPLNRTESRLPSVEDLLADEEMKKMLRTSDAHRLVQEAILVEEEAQKYDALMLLVQKSYEDADWRNDAAKDNSLIDTLVLFIRQRVTEAQNPFQTPGGDFLGRSSRTLKTLTSKSLKRSNTQSSETSRSSNAAVSGSPSSSVSRFPSFVPDKELFYRAVVAIALAGPAIKLLRNLCVNNKECQAYLHEHRLIDLLMDHTDLIAEVTHQAEKVNSENSIEPDLPSASVLLSLVPRRLPQWVTFELVSFPRSMVQLVTNAVSGVPAIQAHLLLHIYPDALIKTIVLSGDAELLSCLLHCLTVQQPTSTVHELLVSDERSVQIWYLLLSAALRQAEPEKRESIAYKRLKTTSPEAIEKFQGEWLSLFFSSFLKREYKKKLFFVELTETLLRCDASSFRVILPKLVLTHPAPTRSPSRSYSPSRRSSYEITTEWQDYVHYKVDKVFVTSKPDVLCFFFSLVEALLDGELSQQPLRTDGMGVSFISSVETLTFLLSHFDASTEHLRKQQPVDSEDNNSDIQVLTQSFKALVRVLASLSAISCLLADTVLKSQFDTVLGTLLVIRILALLDKVHLLQRSKDSQWDLINRVLSRRDLLLAVANLCYRAPANQKAFGLNQGVQILLSFAHIDPDDPLMEQAAMFGLRNACQHPDNSQILTQLLQSQTSLIRSVDEFKQPDALVVGKFNKDEGDVTRIEKIQ